MQVCIETPDSVALNRGPKNNLWMQSSTALKGTRTMREALCVRDVKMIFKDDDFCEGKHTCCIQVAGERKSVCVMWTE